MTEYLVAPVDMRITWDVQKYNDEWSYQIKMYFHFKHNPDEKIEDILTGFGVYTFKSENHARVEGKRTAKQYEEHFRDKLAELILNVVEGQEPTKE